MEMGRWFNISSEGPEKWGIDLATPGLVVHCVIDMIKSEYEWRKKKKRHLQGIRDDLEIIMFSHQS